jgi:hypothetical protein
VPVAEPLFVVPLQLSAPFSPVPVPVPVPAPIPDWAPVPEFVEPELFSVPVPAPDPPADPEPAELPLEDPPAPLAAPPEPPDDCASADVAKPSETKDTAISFRSMIFSIAFLFSPVEPPHYAIVPVRNCTQRRIRLVSGSSLELTLQHVCGKPCGRVRSRGAWQALPDFTERSLSADDKSALLGKISSSMTSICAPVRDCEPRAPCRQGICDNVRSTRVRASLAIPNSPGYPKFRGSSAHGLETRAFCLTPPSTCLGGMVQDR